MYKIHAVPNCSFWEGTTTSDCVGLIAMVFGNVELADYIHANHVSNFLDIFML